MAQFLVITVIPWMYKCETCNQPIMEREAVGIRTNEGKNLYYHLDPKCEPPDSWLGSIQHGGD